MLLLLAPLLCFSAQSELRVANVTELRAAARQAGPGTRILLEPGEYEGGLFLEGLKGAPGKPIVIAGADPERPPRLRGGGDGLHLSRVEHLELRSLHIEGARGNGLNVDDGGERLSPSRHILLHGIVVRDTGSGGNEDGIKLSGLSDFQLVDCTVERWGREGSAVDMVGCRRGRIEGCRFVHDGGGSSGVQMKGGSSEITVRRSCFQNAGLRALHLGGSTKLEYFRPPLGDPPHAEARAILVEENLIRGSDSAIAFVGVDGAIVRRNTIVNPRRWAIRILQETTAPGFVPCRKGVFERNLVVFRSDSWSEGGVNIGPNTAPATFRFAQNWWFCSDEPARSEPRLPSEEQGAVHGRDPARDPSAKDYGAPSRD